MDLVEIDPTLFVTCRLCLADMGMYQVVPKIKEQIKYCFDIDVELFDGLPQLICKKCQSILTEFYNTKSKFVEKQNSLKARFKVNNDVHVKSCGSPQQETVSSSQQIDNHIVKQCNAKKEDFGSLNDINDDDYNIVNSVNKKRKRRSKTPSAPFEAYYKKEYVCTLCQKHCKKKSSLRKHFTKHKNLVSQHHDILRTYCTIDLNKIDNAPNLTGQNNTVVHSETKIIANEGEFYYYILYTQKDRSDSRISLYSKESIGKNAYLESSDDEVSVKRQHKRRRLLSRSSNETVVLGDENKSPRSSDNEDNNTSIRETGLDDNDCINIDDSSDSESTKSHIDLRGNTGATKPVKAKITDYKKILNISSVCEGKYLRHDSYDNGNVSPNTETQLKHKILNIGRKIINKQGINCNGLLRFMEYKNLDIEWLSSNVSLLVNKENYIRLIPKLRGTERCINEWGWKNLPAVPSNEPLMKKIESQSRVLVNVTVDKANNSAVVVEPPVKTTTDIMNIENIINNVIDQAVLYSPVNADSDVSSKNKLLNANPVANPKQLPKKATVIDTKSSAPCEGVANVQQNSDPLYFFINNDEQNSNGDLCMPIITSTTSLAPRDENEHSNKDSNAVSGNNDSDKSAPRIKVKPASELMSDRVLKNICQQQVTTSNNVWDINQCLYVPSQNTGRQIYVTSMAPPRGLNNAIPAPPLYTLVAAPAPEPAPAPAPAPAPTPAPAPSSSEVATHQPAEREYVILHTAELPNTKTDSPFRYFKQLLYIHNIILLEANETAIGNFVSLIKFKLQFKEDRVDQPVVLYLNIMCAENKYHLGVKYSGQENSINLNKLPANWQWQILNKIYQYEVVNKIIKTAEKISQYVHDNTKRFICLLKSIKFVKEV